MFVSPSTVAVFRQRTKAVRCWVQAMSQSYTTSAAPPPTGGLRVIVTRHRSREGSRQCTRRLVRDYQQIQRFGGEAGVREGHCRRLHAIEQLLKMKPHSMRPILADRGVDVVAAGRRDPVLASCSVLYPRAVHLIWPYKWIADTTSTSEQ